MHSMGFRGLVIALATAASVLCCATAIAGYRFEDPAVFDLSIDERLAPLTKGAPIAATPLAGDAAKAIVAAPEVGNDAPGQVPMLPGTDKAERKQEQARIAAAAPAVQRSGKTLSIKTQGAGVEFSDRRPPPRADADQDGEMFFYAGRVGATSYHRVEERFQQDAPASYFVNAANGKRLFAPNGSYVVQLSPDGKWLLSMSAGDTRVLLVVMALDADGPNLALLCHGDSAVNAGPGAFKGWHDDGSFDLQLNPLVLAPGKPGQGAATTLPPESIPLRFAFDGQGWQVRTPDPKALDRVGYVCRR
jgi:hypothetical protein